MPGETKIEWASHTWNPVTGCTKVSAGCDHCYAATFAERWRGIPGHPYEQGFDLKLWPERLALPLRWTKPRRIFVNSMSDLFHADVPDEFVSAVFGVMAAASQHTYMILTKRPQRMYRWLSSNDVPMVPGGNRQDSVIWEWAYPGLGPILRKWPVWPLPNVWLGVSVENQEAAYRIDWLVKTPAAIRFLSCEPLLGPLDLSKWLWGEAGPEWAGKNPSPDLGWVIAGGESGPGFRPVDPEWIRNLRDQCVAAGVPFFMKQIGGRTPKAGGRELDGRTWDQFPAVAS